MYTVMRMSWVAAYAKGSEQILQHWLWKLLKDKTEHLSPLLKVFSDNPGTAPSCAADWTHIFTLYSTPSLEPPSRTNFCVCLLLQYLLQSMGPVRNPVLEHRVAPCFPLFLSFGKRTQNSRVAGASPTTSPSGDLIPTIRGSGAHLGRVLASCLEKCLTFKDVDVHS